jgi:thiamine-phosphate pyrophosphorylase
LAGGADVDRVAALLPEALAAADVATLLLRWQPGLENRAVRAEADRLRAIAQARDVALLIEDRADLAHGLGADGVHLASLAGYDEARRRLGPDAVIGVGCATRHDAMTAGEGGADYVLFGGFDDAAPEDSTLELTRWWSELMTVPCVTAGCGSAADARALTEAGADFIALGAPAWQGAADPAALLRAIAVAVAPIPPSP